ncbi:MAG: hypothetical protein RMI43_07050 [Candidatus Caldarchaeum sp.]|nr:hypothetical protein [Candidatus Caldarchaeum sp.]MCX8201311.1 hypothetical protein [Candidatus Caldarchaeum sp.]MDW8063911.1 hypothetical protein [Candidatus Caldarchaeum sp.]MDW8434781.1 hypothetical protein [Candidatus Caldarchaeum sp.]
MSWLLRSSRPRQTDVDKPFETVMGVSCVIKNVGEDLVVEGRARTKKDADRLKRIMNEMLNEALGSGDEAK